MIPIRDTAPCYNKPLVSWTIMAICITIFLSMQFMPDAVVFRILNQYGMVPIRYTNPYFGLPFDGYMSFFTSLFLHGNWIHIIMNMWFLWIFGDNVEDRMGRLRFSVFYVLCGLLATFLQWYFDPTLTVPVVGASGAIAGVLGAYFFLYPLERVVVWVPILFFPVIVHVPAIAFLGLWIMLQLHNATATVLFDSTVDVAWWAHLGGFIAGAVLYRFFITEQAEQ
ncbi:MAG: rhomboid family intramembrane serine protease [Methylococcales bacterium]